MGKMCCQTSSMLIQKITQENNKLSQLDKKKSFIADKSQILDDRIDSMELETLRFGNMFVSQFIFSVLGKHLKYEIQTALIDKKIERHQKTKENLINEVDLVINSICNSDSGCKFLNDRLESF